MSQAPEADREIVMNRVINAPRDLVFEAWTAEKHVAQWFGPDGFTTTTYEMDFRPGGVWRFTMHGPGGKDWPNLIEYREIVSPERLVYDHGDGGETMPPFHVTVTFEDRDGKTNLTMRTLFETPEQRDGTLKFGAVELGYQTLGKLETYLASLN